ncbi:MAG: cytochrome c peroxidase [Sulfurimonas sp.]|jgi:cytochrome c peroxidase|nr:cytochrome c peroxidase [Sulfurimonadaceae bacterium]
MQTKQLLLRALYIAIAVVVTLWSVAYFTHDRFAKELDDNTLRQRAIESKLLSMPKSFNELKKLIDNPANPMSKEKILLGKKLFFDTNLSHSGKTSCATCHPFNPDKNHKVLEQSLLEEAPNNCLACHQNDQSGADRLTFSVGDGGVAHPHLLNVQSVINSGFYKYYTWSGEVESISDEAMDSFFAKHKMALGEDELNLKLLTYKDEFEKASLTPNAKSAADAIEVYVKTLVSRGDFDRFIEGDDSAISEAAKRGLTDFMHFGCKGCHQSSSFGAKAIQRFPLRDFVGFYELRVNESLVKQMSELDSRFPFKNQGDFVGKDSNYHFRVPSLRNVTKTSPYFHNGAIPRIREAVDIMARHQIGRALRDEQIDDIVAFLRTLEGELVEYDYE